MYDVNEKFENLVLFMAENYNSYDTELNDAITTFEEAIETSGNGLAHDDSNDCIVCTCSNFDHHISCSGNIRNHRQ